MAEKNEIDRYLIVTVPVAELYREPVDQARLLRENEYLLETQVLLNEILLYRGENDEWYQVEAIEQADFSPDVMWRGYPGWVRKNAVRAFEKVKRNNAVVKEKTADVYVDPGQKSEIIATVSMGTRFHVMGEEIHGYSPVSLPDGGNGWVKKGSLRAMTKRKAGEERLRKNIVKTAGMLLKTPYLWGGRSAAPAAKGERPERGEDRKREVGDQPLRSIVTGVDCSGLTSIVFRANNVDVPRNAHVQWMVTHKTSPDMVEPGDLLFVSNQGEFYKMNHVMICVGAEEFIEASETDVVVCTNSFRRKFGKTREELARQNFVVEGRKIHGGKMPLAK